MTLTLVFSLGEERYGLEIDAIQEIVEDPRLHFVPRASGVLCGAANIHGRILAVIDLPQLLGWADSACDHRHLVLTTEFKGLVLKVSGVQRIVSLDLAALQPPPEALQGKAVRGLAALDETTVNLLDTEAIFKRLEEIYAA